MVVESLLKHGALNSRRPGFARALIFKISYEGNDGQSRCIIDKDVHVIWHEAEDTQGELILLSKFTQFGGANSNEIFIGK